MENIYEQIVPQPGIQQDGPPPPRPEPHAPVPQPE